MKNELRSAIRQGINNSELNGYKWTITPGGLKWSYGDEFTFEAKSMPDDEIFLYVKNASTGRIMAALVVGTADDADASNLVDAYRIATEKTIRNANRIY